MLMIDWAANLHYNFKPKRNKNDKWKDPKTETYELITREANEDLLKLG